MATMLGGEGADGERGGTECEPDAPSVAPGLALVNTCVRPCTPYVPSYSLSLIPPDRPLIALCLQSWTCGVVVFLKKKKKKKNTKVGPY